MSDIVKDFKEWLNPTEPPGPSVEVATFLQTDFGKEVQSYFLADFDYTMKTGYREAHQMLEEERQKIKQLQKESEETYRKSLEDIMVRDARIAILEDELTKSKEIK